MAKILILDHSHDVLDAMKMLLEFEGHSVRTASSKDSLFKELTTLVPDLIILDTHLNRNFGREICKEVTANETMKNIPIILMSVNNKLLEDYKECGAIDILEKSFHFPDLKKKIKAALQNLLV